jgi:hypothetical protein
VQRDGSARTPARSVYKNGACSCLDSIPLPHWHLLCSRPTQSTFFPPLPTWPLMEVIMYQPNHQSTSRASRPISSLYRPWSTHSVSTSLSFSEDRSGDNLLGENSLPEVIIDLTIDDSSDDVPEIAWEDYKGALEFFRVGSVRPMLILSLLQSA